MAAAKKVTEKVHEKVINQGYEIVPIAKLKQHPRNPRHGDLGAISQSIDRNGFYGAVIVQKSTGYILAGNHRLKAAEENGIGGVPVIWVDVDDERALRILLADNRTNDLAGYDNAALAEILTGIQADTGNLLGTGYDGEALENLLKELGDAEIARGEEEEGGGEPGAANTPIIQYNIIFNSADEQKVWFEFLKALRAEHPDLTISERIVKYIGERKAAAA